MYISFSFFLALAVAPFWIPPLPTRIYRHPGPCVAPLDSRPPAQAGSRAGSGGWGVVRLRQ